MPNTHRVLRQFQAGGALRNPGELVDAAEWKNAKALEDQRYMERLDTDAPTLAGPGPTPDPKLIQELKARAGESKNSEAGGVASIPEIEGEATTDEPAEDAAEGSALRGKLPEDFPGRAALEAEGVTTYAQVRRRIADGTLSDVSGVGGKTAAKIEEAASAE